MCDPTVLTIATTVAGLAGQASSYFGQQAAMKDQEKAYNEWAAQQSKNRANENARQEQMRQESQKAQQQGLQDVSAQNQKQTQAEEQSRLTGYLQGGGPEGEAPTPVSVADRSLTGQGAGGGDAPAGDPFQTELAKKINEATSDSRQRIAALAKVSSYGGSEGGLDTMTREALAKSGRGIDVTNDLRRGSLGAYGIEQAVNPKQISYTPGPLSMLSPLLGVGMQGLGGMMAKATVPSGIGAAGTSGAWKPFSYGGQSWHMAV